ncbi:MAG: hypothetical protein M1820_009374 [Bogoriella megaspora]|nr:MAG: hypothetical protein M1820_009374 [Bogoriella megaspora]
MSVARRVFDALEGTWTIRRRLKSAIPGYPTGFFQGSATFSPRDTTANTFDAEYLYHEEGELTTEAGLKMQANRKYAYRYQSSKDQITTWFIKDDGISVDYLFNELQHDPSKMGNKQEALLLDGDHLCVNDMYKASYDFQSLGPEMTFSVTYHVQGPKKDYSHETTTMFNKTLPSRSEIQSRAVKAAERMARQSPAHFRYSMVKNMHRITSLERLINPEYDGRKCDPRDREWRPLSYLAKHLSESSLRKLRLVSKTISKGIVHSRLELYRHAHIHYESGSRNAEKYVGALHRIGSHCRELSIRLRPLRKLGTAPGDYDSKYRGSQESIGSATADLLNLYQALRTDPLSSMDRGASKFDGASAWALLFKCVPSTSVINITVDDADTNWHPFTEVERTLIEIRIALETFFRDVSHEQGSRLHTIRIAPATIMAVFAIRWSGSSAYSVSGGPDQSKSQLWRSLARLDIQLRNPYVGSSKTGRSMASKILHDYFDSFKRTLRVLSFTWLDDIGPNPLILDIEAQVRRGKSGRRRSKNFSAPPIFWEKLQEVWLGAVRVGPFAAAMIISRARNLRNLMIQKEHNWVVAGHGHTLNMGNLCAWYNVLEDFESVPVSESAVLDEIETYGWIMQSDLDIEVKDDDIHGQWFASDTEDWDSRAGDIASRSSYDVPFVMDYGMD